MKIAISATGENLDSEIAEVFGRCPYFILADILDKEIRNTETIKNESGEQKSGAGMAAAKLIVEKGAEVLIASNVGPRALDVLKQFDIKIIIASGKASQAVQDFINK